MNNQSASPYQAGLNYLTQQGQQQPVWQQQPRFQFSQGAQNQGAAMFGGGTYPNQSPANFNQMAPVVDLGTQYSNENSGMWGKVGGALGFGTDDNGIQNQGAFGAQGWGNIIGAGASLGNAYFANQAMKQGKKEFKFNKGLAQTNLANQAKLINTGQERRARSNAASLGLQGDAAQQFITDRTNKEQVRGNI